MDNYDIWSGEFTHELSKIKDNMSPSEQRRYKLPMLLRLTQRVALFSPECETCQGLQSQIISIGTKFNYSPRMNRQNFRSYLSVIKGIIKHLKRTHGLVEERQYVKRYLFMGMIFGLSVIALGLILLNFGITLLALNVTAPALVTRIIFSGTIGYILDRRAKSRGNVL